MMLFFYLSISFIAGVVAGVGLERTNRLSLPDEEDEAMAEDLRSAVREDHDLGPYRQAGKVDEDEEDKEPLTIPSFESDFAEVSHEDQIVVYDFSNEHDPFVSCVMGDTIKEIRELIEEYKEAAEKLEAKSISNLKKGYPSSARDDMKQSADMKKRVQKLEMIISKHKMKVQPNKVQAA
jgi:hypothetical protein